MSIASAATLNFAIDGGVAKVDGLRLQEELGVVGGREPRWAIARKFAPDIAITQLRAIGVNVGRTGALNPYAVLEPVEIGGAMVKLATLHNFDLIAEKDFRVGDWVQVKRAGEVIPQLIAPLVDRRDKDHPPPVTEVPTRCPVCNTPVERDPEEVAIYCPNVSCPGRRLEALVHFASRDAMDIRGLSYARIKQLVEPDSVTDIADLFQLTAPALAALDRLGEKSAAAWSPRSRESPAPWRGSSSGSGIRHVGSTAAELLARRFGTLDALAGSTEAEILGSAWHWGDDRACRHGILRGPTAKRLIARLRRLGSTSPSHVTWRLAVSSRA